MATTKQLFHLEETDAEIEAEEQALAEKNGQLGNRKVLEDAQAKLEAVKNRLAGLKAEQRNAEAEVEDITSKINAADEQLYGGKITNPKELSSLQHEVGTFKEKRDHLETGALEIIDRVEAAEKAMAAGTAAFGKLEAEWQQRQKELVVEIKQHKGRLKELNETREQQAGEINAEALALYENIRRSKKPAVARVEQGICRSCRISLSASELQRARAGQPIPCGSCGRILYVS